MWLGEEASFSVCTLSLFSSFPYTVFIFLSIWIVCISLFLVYKSSNKIAFLHALPHGFTHPKTHVCMHSLPAILVLCVLYYRVFIITNQIYSSTSKIFPRRSWFMWEILRFIGWMAWVAWVGWIISNVIQCLSLFVVLQFYNAMGTIVFKCFDNFKTDEFQFNPERKSSFSE